MKNNYFQEKVIYELYYIGGKKYYRGKNMVQLHEQIFRDAHQSLIATRMRTEDMLPITNKIDKVGFFSFEVWGGATFDSCIRFLNEDPWERLRTLKEHLPDTPLQMLERGQNIVAYRNYPDDVVQEFIKYAIKNGCDYFRIFDALNDVRNMKTAIESVKSHGKHVQSCICYTISPVHTNELFVNIAKDLEKIGSDSLCIKDMAGLISPPKAYELISELKDKTKIPIDLHSHCTSGMGSMSYMEACRAGVDILDTSMSPFSGGTAQPPTESVVAALKDTPYDTGYDLELLNECKEYFSKVWNNYSHLHSQKSLKIDPSVILHQIPGGMLSNLVSQLKKQNALDKYDEVLKETPRVRKELGYPPLVTPTSQIVGTQAVLNVVLGERYKIIPNEVKDYVRGMYGKPPGEISDDMKTKVLGKEWEEQIITCRPASLLANKLKEIRQEAEDLDIISKEEDVITYAIYRDTFPDIAKKFLKGEMKAEFTSDMLPLKIAEKLISTQPRVVGKTREFSVEVSGKIYDVKVGELGGSTFQIKGGSIPSRQSKVISKPKLVEQKPTKYDNKKFIEGSICAPMQGTITKVKVGTGDSVKSGDIVAVLEAMKMENELKAQKDGVVKEVNVKEGESCNLGQVIVVIG